MTVGVIGGAIFPSLWWVGGLIYGLVVGEVAFTTSSRRSGPKVEGVAVAAILAGTVAVPMVIALIGVGSDLGNVDWINAIGLADPWKWAVVLIAIFFALSRLRNR